MPTRPTLAKLRAWVDANTARPKPARIVANRRLTMLIEFAAALPRHYARRATALQGRALFGAGGLVFEMTEMTFSR